MPEFASLNLCSTETVVPWFLIGAGVGVGTGEPASTDPPADPPADPAADDPVDDPAKSKPKPTETLEFWKAKAREQENRAKANADKAVKFDALEEAKKSDEQKAADRIAKAEQRAAELELRTDRAEVAAATGVPVEILAGPKGKTAEEIQAYADMLKEWAERDASAKPPVGVHVSTEGKDAPSVSIDEQIAAASKAGNHALAIRLKRQKAQS